MVTARVARDDLRAKTFVPLAQTSEMEEADLDSIHLDVFTAVQEEQEAAQTPSRLSRTSDIVIVEGNMDWDQVNL
jgi:hypothetical protein